MLSHMQEKPLFQNHAVASIGISFSEDYIQIPGFIAAVLLQLTVQQINLIEIASTFTELTLYVDQENTKLAFDTLEHLFKQQNKF